MKKREEIKSITVFCGSSLGNNPIYTKHAKELGRLLATKEITLVYGGGERGLMGALSNAALENGGKVIGIIPKILISRERKSDRLNEVYVVENMHERKKMLYEKGDAFVILSGGFGTMDEFFEAQTWNQLGIHNKKIFILNTNGFWNHLIDQIKTMQVEGFLYRSVDESITIVDSPEELGI